MCPNYYTIHAFSKFFFKLCCFFHFDIFILCKMFHCLFPSSTCAVESWVEIEASCKCWWFLTFFILNLKMIMRHVWRCVIVYYVFPAWMEYCFQLCSDMKENSMSLTSPAYFNLNFVGYDTVADYRHFGWICCLHLQLSAGNSEMLETMYNTTWCYKADGHYLYFYHCENFCSFV